MNPTRSERPNLLLRIFGCKEDRIETSPCPTCGAPRNIRVLETPDERLARLYIEGDMETDDFLAGIEGTHS